MITLKLNGKTIKAEEGEYILQVAGRNGVDIPSLCLHKASEPAGMCRLCTVEVFDGRRTRFVTACNYPVWEGMEVKTDTEDVHQVRKLLMELLLARCPEVPYVKNIAAKYGIHESRFKKKDDDCILCGLCVRICERMGNSAISLTGRGADMKVDTPFHEQTDFCMGCGACAYICPTGHIKLEDITKKDVKPIPSEYDMGLKGRKPIYVPYAQAIPNIPAIDRDTCIHFKTGECKICTEFCGVNAIDHSQEDEIVELNVGSIILAPGFQPFDPSKFDTYSYAKHPNVITSMEFERILSASGPTLGHLVRPSDHKEPKKIAWLQCVGSRDINRCDHGFCSSVCCMYAIKEAVIAKEHSGSDLDCSIFYMDMRTHGKDFERYYDDAREKHGVRFIRSRVHTIDSVEEGDELIMKYATESGEFVEELFDMVVLSVGMETPPELSKLVSKLGIELTEGDFCQTDSFHPVATSREGIYVCGALAGPKDIPQSVIEASSAAAEAGALLSGARNTLTKTSEVPEERNVTGERPRIGVFVCHCGINIGGVVDVPAVRDYASSLPYVEYVSDNLYSCSQDSQEAISQVIETNNLNRIVVAACTPKTHEPLFQETLTSAGLNKYLFEMTNIRNHDSWVHKDDPEKATEKAKDLVRMAVTKAALVEPLQEAEAAVDQRALVIGGGISGMAAAKSLSAQGYEVCLVERAASLGGQALSLHKTWKGEDVQENLADLIGSVETDGNIDLRLGTELSNVEGFVGNFKTTLAFEGKEEVIEHGVAFIATGASEFKPREYLYGEDPRVITHQELDKRFIENDPSLKEMKSAVFIQCVGSREAERPYCSRVCCTHSMESALHLKEIDPEMDVYILYRDIRTYGERETLYRKARAAGVLFFRFSTDQKPRVTVGQDCLEIEVIDHILEKPVLLKADLVSLATAIVPYKDEKLAQFFKIPMNENGFFVEAHAKLGPSQFATDGVFLCGMAHYPKPIDESVAQAQAAASRAITLLARKKIRVSGAIAQVNFGSCSSCGVCIDVCPYSAPSFVKEGRFKGKAEINPVLCKGCGLCVASCRSGALNLKGFGEDQILAMINEI
ncbi:MAG TPA: FAD-dependent oxidoreductase [Deltaproteobacteria bacterium]|nr:FAD-dependent oxidoreductase [Deltaproteobacteria bacterium]